MASSLAEDGVELEIVAAVSQNLAIGRDGGLPWHLPEDLRHFKELTMGHPIIMGHRTFLSIGHPLPGRRNLVLSSDSRLDLPQGVERFGSLEDALAAVGTGKAFAIGGERVFAEALWRARALNITRIDEEFPGDTFFPDWSEMPFELADRSEHFSGSGGFFYYFERWQRA